MNSTLRYQRGITGLLALAFVAWAPVAGAKWANPQLLVTPEELQKNIEKRDWVVVDCRRLETYLKGHIPGAISLGKPCGEALRDPTSRIFKDVKKYESLFGKVGIANNTHVVVYSYDGDLRDATVAFWVMEYLGHDGKVHLLNGGLDAWRKAGLRLGDKPTIKEPTTFKAQVVKSRYATTDEILKIANGQVKGVQLVDSRTGKEHKGEDIRALRGGHIPNTSLNVSHLETLPKVKDPKTGREAYIGYLDPDLAEKAFGKLDKNVRTIAYCQTGTRSTMTYLQFRLMGFKDPANWDDSWQVYGSTLGYPVADEQLYDFAKVNSDLSSLEKKIKTLEAAAAKPAGK